MVLGSHSVLKQSDIYTEKCSLVRKDSRELLQVVDGGPTCSETVSCTVGGLLTSQQQRNVSRNEIGVSIHSNRWIVQTQFLKVAGVFSVLMLIIVVTMSLNLPTPEEYDLAKEYSSIYNGAGGTMMWSRSNIASTIHTAQQEANNALALFSAPTDATDNESMMPKSSLRSFWESLPSFVDVQELSGSDGDGTSANVLLNMTNKSSMLLGRSKDSNYELHEGCETTVMILRHCEKCAVREHCSYDGFERSVFLATQFGDHQSNRWPLPSYLFATNPSGRDNKRKLNLREIELLSPLAKKAQLQIDDTYMEGQEGDLARDMIQFIKTGGMCGKVAIVSWKHSLIGHLARKLGCGPLQGCPVDYKGKLFDDVWEIKFVYEIPEHSIRKNLVTLETEPSWNVYGSVQHENFDPLAFSKLYGDYPSGGTSTGARWRSEEVSFPNRKDKYDTDVWHETEVGFHD